MEAPLLIGIAGGMGHGKDTLARAICELYPDTYITCKFAGALRHAVSILAHVPADRSEAPEDKAAPLPEVRTPQLRGRVARAVAIVTADAGPGVVDAIVATILEKCAVPVTVGRFLQIVGTDCFRAAVGPNVWVDALLGPWRAAGCPAMIVADVRFPNEARAIRDAGGVVIQVVRKSQTAEGGFVSADGRDARHPSEHALGPDDVDAVLPNDGYRAELSQAFVAALPRLRAARTQG
jgi:hypothetical protein